MVLRTTWGRVSCPESIRTGYSAPFDRAWRKRHNQLANEAINKQAKYVHCQFSGSSINAYNVSFEDVAALVSSSESYALATFSFDLVGIPSSIKAPAKRAAMTAEEKAKALAAFEARIPPLAKQ